MTIDRCPFCQGTLAIRKLKCLDCEFAVEGPFFTSPLLCLSADEQLFAELFILASGSLKEMAGTLGVTYPTIRSRLDAIIQKLKKNIKDRQEYSDNLLKQVAAGKLRPEAAATIIKNL